MKDVGRTERLKDKKASEARRRKEIKAQRRVVRRIADNMRQMDEKIGKGDIL